MKSCLAPLKERRPSAIAQEVHSATVVPLTSESTNSGDLNPADRMQGEPGYLPGNCWQLDSPPIEFTSARDKSTLDYRPGTYRRLMLGAILADREADGFAQFPPPLSRGRINASS